MATYNGHTFHTGYMGTALVGASGLSYTVTDGVPVLTVGSITGGNEVPIISWESNKTTEMAEFRNSKSGPTPLKETTFQDDKGINIIADYDFAANPFLTANGGIYVGATLNWVLLFLNQTKKSGLDGKFMTYSSLIVMSTPMRVEVNGRIGMSFRCEASGPFWDPQS